MLERTAAELLKIRNFGEKSLDELRVRLEDNDFPVPDSFQERNEELAKPESAPEDTEHHTDAHSADEVESVTEPSKED